MVVYSRARQGVACAHFARGEGAYAANLAGRVGVASFPGTAGQSGFRHLLSCARADRDLGEGGKSVGGRRLRPGGRKSDAVRLRRGTRDLLDRLCSGMAWNAGRKGGAETAR